MLEAYRDAFVKTFGLTLIGENVHAQNYQNKRTQMTYWKPLQLVLVGEADERWSLVLTYGLGSIRTEGSGMFERDFLVALTAAAEVYAASQRKEAA